jgi:hypothetical protein
VLVKRVWDEEQNAGDHPSAYIHFHASWSLPSTQERSRYLSLQCRCDACRRPSQAPAMSTANDIPRVPSRVMCCQNVAKQCLNPLPCRLRPRW